IGGGPHRREPRRARARRAARKARAGESAVRRHRARRSIRMTNIAEARRVIEEAAARGATDFCVCAGSRNAPLLAVLGACADLKSSTDKSVCATQSPAPGTDPATKPEPCGTDTPVCASELRIFSFVDERSAAFFALGRAKLTGRPTVVITTSGPAVAELLPAALEAHYSA